MKPFVLDREAARKDLKRIEEELSAIKRDMRPEYGPSKVRLFTRNGHRVVKVVRGELIRSGRSFTSAEGRSYHALKHQATLLCTSLALAHGPRRIHNTPYLRNPDGLLHVIACMRLYEKKPEVIVPAAAPVEETQPETQTVSVMEVQS